MRHLPQPAYMNQSLEELRLGTLTDIATVSMPYARGAGLLHSSPIRSTFATNAR